MMMTITTDQKTPLHDHHVAQGAKMVDFAGWQMPLQFSKVIEEHHAVRKAAGLFDISHMGLVCVRSGNLEATRAFLDTLVPQDLTKLYPGKAVYTQFLNPQGGILDDIIVYQLPEAVPAFEGFQEFLVICNASNTPLDMDWMKAHRPEGLDVEIELLSQQYSLLALQGPHFAQLLNQLGCPTESLPKRFHLGPAQLKGIPALIARTGYTGEDGVELIVPNTQVEALWNELLNVGKPLGVLPIGLAARDTLRLEAALPLHGHDINDQVTPLEAGLGWSVKLAKASDFVGKAALLNQKERGVDRQFYCFRLIKKTIPRQHDRIFKNGQPVGEVTSGSISPLLNEPIGMGYFQASSVSGPGDTCQIEIRGNLVDADIVERPFYKVR